MRALPKLPLGRALSHHKQEAGCIYVNNAECWNAIIHLGYTVPRNRLRLVLVLTTTPSLVLTFFGSVTLEVVLPSAFSNFQSAHSGVTCTVQCSTCQLPLNKPHNGRLAALFPEVTHEFLQRELEYTVGLDREVHRWKSS